MFNAQNCSRFWQSLYEERNIFHTVKMAVGNSIERQGFLSFEQPKNFITWSLRFSVLTKNQTIFCFQRYIGIPGMLSMRLNVVEHLFIVFESNCSSYLHLKHGHCTFHSSSRIFRFLSIPIFLFSSFSCGKFAVVCLFVKFVKVRRFWCIHSLKYLFSCPNFLFSHMFPYKNCAWHGLSLRACALPRGTENSASYTTVYP